jgi:putative peptidoglycan lipid II flippase
MKSTEGKTLKSSIIISFFVLLTSVFNYLALFLLAATFGTRMEMDAYFAAITIPQIITLILLATLSTTFIPVYIEARSTDEPRAWRLASLSVNLVFCLLFVIALIGSILSKHVIAHVNPGFPGETSNLASSLFRLFLISVVFSGTSIILSSLYYAQQRFIKAPFMQWMSSFVTFLFVLLLCPSLGIKSIALGMLAGSLIQFFTLFTILWRRYSLSFDFRDKDIVKLAKLIVPLLIGSIFYRSNTLVERFIASKLGKGSISYLGYAYKIIMALVLLINQGISTVLFPRMAESSAIADFKGLKETLSKGIRALIIITAPVAVMIVFARLELVQIIFERGSFSHQDTIAVSQALIAYLGFFVVSALALPIVNTLYSLQKTFRVAAVGVLGFTLYVLLALLLSKYFAYMGIALAVSIQYVISLVVFVFMVRMELGKFDSRPIIQCIFKALVASGMAFLSIFSIRKLVVLPIEHPFDSIVFGVLGFAFYFVLLKIFKTEELRFLSIKTAFR